ncbi:MAG: lysostaphin resistance A-like protein [Candidatus Bathyarchaeia archaeon]
MVRSPALKIFLVYFIVAFMVLLGAYSFPRESALSEAVPVLLSVGLLVPLYIWHRSYAEEDKLSKEIDGRPRSAVLFWILILFILALAVRIPSVLLLGMTYEKTPLIYLLILTIVVIERTNVSVFGFRSEKIGLSLLKGATFYLVLGGSMLSIEYLLIYALTDQAIWVSFSILPFLFAMPFQTLCVGMSEEGFFRGYIQTHLEKVSTFRRAILAQAFLFGLWHFVWNISPFNLLGMGIYVTTSCIWGSLAGYFYGKSRSLISVIFTHGLWNSVIIGMLTNEAALSALERMPLLSQIAVHLLPHIIGGMFTFVFIKYLPAGIYQPVRSD